ncbi:hypothetical protein [Deinococcus phoenicis]|uniref:hypothetical protein n=1 Tax=Deinococcus phoenicis TaxID=1476583 RepID=UPI0004B3AA5C|nr:hypothetical protein [Deinococcus phoenicis]
MVEAGPLAVTELNAGDASRASHVWRVESAQGPVVLRRSWWTSPDVSAFMLGLSRLFGVDPRDLPATAAAYGFWRGLGVWSVPEVLGTVDFRDAPALRVAFVPGEARHELQQADAAELGRRVAAVHAHAVDGFGPVTGNPLRPLTDFYPHALKVVREVAAHFGPDAWADHWPEVERPSLPPPPPPAPSRCCWTGTARSSCGVTGSPLPWWMWRRRPLRLCAAGTRPVPLGSAAGPGGGAGLPGRLFRNPPLSRPRPPPPRVPPDSTRAGSGRLTAAARLARPPTPLRLLTAER